MKSVTQARKVFVSIAVLFLLMDLGAFAVLMSKAGRSAVERGKELESLRLERTEKEADARPTRDMDKKLVRARESITGFYAQKLPANYSDISEDLGKLAADNHLMLSQVHYDTKASPVPNVNGVLMNVSITGSYRSVMEFINTLERDHRFYVLDRVVIGDAGTSNDLRVEIQLETYLKVAS